MSDIKDDLQRVTSLHPKVKQALENIYTQAHKEAEKGGSKILVTLSLDKYTKREINSIYGLLHEEGLYVQVPFEATETEVKFEVSWT